MRKTVQTIIAIIFLSVNTQTFAAGKPRMGMTLAEAYMLCDLTMPSNFGIRDSKETTPEQKLVTKKQMATIENDIINITINNKKLVLVPVNKAKSYKLEKQEPVTASVAVLKKSEMIIPATAQVSTSALTVKKPQIYESLISSNDSLLLLEGLTSIYNYKSRLVGDLIYRTKKYVSKSFSVKESGDEKTFSVNETKGFYKNFMVTFRDGSNVISYRGNLGDNVVNQICLDEYFAQRLKKSSILVITKPAYKDMQLVKN